MRQQNPHMHLLEACLVCHESFQAEENLRLAGELVELFSRRFLMAQRQGRFFDANWCRTSQMVEPGHQFEWAWILVRCQRVADADTRSAAEALMWSAEQYRVDSQTGLTVKAHSQRLHGEGHWSWLRGV
jgi:N-acylglucosamine 2-epimerase/mannose-6-phosphate isomerase